MATSDGREHLFQLRLSTKERRALDSLAKARKLPRADVVRTMLLTEAGKGGGNRVLGAVGGKKKTSKR